jgi:transcriptional regulator with XRE-family HTH domain
MKYQNNLKQIRLQKGMTLRQVATTMGLQCEDRLSLWENGKSMPSTVNLIKLCEIYNIQVTEMFPLMFK